MYNRVYKTTKENFGKYQCFCGIYTHLHSCWWVSCYLIGYFEFTIYFVKFV